LGISYAKPKESEVTSGIAQDFTFSAQTSYRAGIIYEFLPRTNAYVSYSQSFEPQLLLTVDQTALPPVTGEQYELGLKYRSANGRMLLTGAVFQLKEKNIGEISQQVNFIDFYRAIGEVNHRGFELQALGQIAPGWQINAGYAYLDPKITNGVYTDSNNPNATAVPSATIGQTELYLPKQTFSLYTSYTMQDGLLRGLLFGGGAHYVSSQRTSYGTLLANQQANPNQQLIPGFTKPIPGYAVVDLNLGYSFDKWLVQLNAHNILDKRYFINNYQTLLYGNMPGDPANVALTVRRTF
jgi:outer-membrane receptor for ferric coprogen and ferric-rhodotorulic acid